MMGGNASARNMMDEMGLEDDFNEGKLPPIQGASSQKNLGGPMGSQPQTRPDFGGQIPLNARPTPQRTPQQSGRAY